MDHMLTEMNQPRAPAVSLCHSIQAKMMEPIKKTTVHISQFRIRDSWFIRNNIYVLMFNPRFNYQVSLEILSCGSRLANAMGEAVL